MRPTKNSKVVFAAAVPHLNVDVHALSPGNLVQAQRLSDHILQLELGARSPRVFCDEFVTKFVTKFGDEFSESLNLVQNLVTKLVTNVVMNGIR